MTIDDFALELEELETAEDFLDYFGVEYDPTVVQVNRLHILQRFHDYVAGVGDLPTDAAERRVLHAGLLASAYRDFVLSDALTEKVFRVFHRHEPRTATVDLADLAGQLPHAS